MYYLLLGEYWINEYLTIEGVKFGALCKTEQEALDSRVSGCIGIVHIKEITDD